MTDAIADTQLTDALLKQISFKPSSVRTAACQVVRALLSGPAFADECDFTAIGQTDRNCIGGAFRQLKRAGVIEHGTAFRRSASKSARGRTIFSWTIKNRRLAETFLERNGVKVDKEQREFAL